MTAGRISAALLLLCALGLTCAPSRARSAADSAVLRLSPAIDALLEPNVWLVTVYRHDTIFDGPVWVPNRGFGYLIFSDVPGNVIDKLNSAGTISVFSRHIFTGRSRSEAYQSFGGPGQKKFWMLGADGITIDLRDRVVYCAYSNGQVIRLGKDGRRTVLASRFAGRRLNAPNDLVYRSDGSLYFTDSRAATRWPDGTGVPYKALYILKAGKVALLSKSIDHPNGVAFSPDEKYLYVTNTRRKNILRFDVENSGIANETVFVDMSGVKGVGAPDGIKVDIRGNVYSTGPGGVWVISPTGEHIGTIRTPDRVSNMAFGGNDYKTLYMTAFGALYRIQLKVAGR